MKEIKKETIFENETKCTEKEYNSFLKVHQKEYALSELLYTVGYSLFLVGCGILLILNKNLLGGVLILGLGILFFIYRNWYPDHIDKKQRKKIKKPITNKYLFYSKYFEVSNKEGKSYTFYFKLYKIIETKKNFYLYVNRDYAFVVSKDGFIKGEEKEFAKFMKKKKMLRYKVR